MTDRPASYAPGWGAEVIAMLSGRTAEDRAAFLLPLLRNGMRLLDVGCGPGSITLGFARRVGPDGDVVGVDVRDGQVDIARRAAGPLGIANAAFRVANAYELPFEAESFDVVFSHALFEHLASPSSALLEMKRVLRSRGLLAVCSSDWSGARVEPNSPDVRRALQGHYALRRRAGGDPFAGARLAQWIAAAGFAVVESGADYKEDMTYAELAGYVGARLRDHMAEAAGGTGAARPIEAACRNDATAATDTACLDALLEEAAAAASRWAERAHAGRAVQRWVHVLARR